MEGHEPLVSVIIPVYNTEKYLKQCIHSIVAQTYDNLEIILVNDGSSDSSGNICDDYAIKDHRIKVIHTENAGVSSARNTGMAEANGEYIMFVDSDDEIVSECVSLLIQAAKQCHSDIVCAESFRYDCGKCIDQEITTIRDLEPLKQSLSNQPYTFSACAKLYHKDAIGESRFSPEIKINEDSLFLFEIFCKKPKLANIKNQVYYYRPNAESSSNAKYSDKFEDILLVSERKYHIIRENFPELLDFADNMMLKARMNLLQILCIRTKGEKRDLEATLIKYIKKNHKSHISTSRHDDQWLKIIRYNLYYAYKLAYYCLKKKH